MCTLGLIKCAWTVSPKFNWKLENDIDNFEETEKCFHGVWKEGKRKGKEREN